MMFEVEEHSSGIWFVTSLECPLLFVAALSEQEAKDKAVIALAEYKSLTAFDIKH